MNTITDRVAAGATWLDEHRPGWVDRIDLDTLELSDTCNCVLGQEYGGYWLDLDAGVVAGVGKPRDAVKLGFASSGTFEDPLSYASLTQAWRDYIVDRRAVALPHGGQHCSCPIPCETCGADTLTGYLSGCEECSERRQCAYGRAEFGDVPAPGGAA